MSNVQTIKPFGSALRRHQVFNVVRSSLLLFGMVFTSKQQAFAQPPPPPPVIFFTSTTVSVWEDDTYVTVSIKLSAPSSQTVKVQATTQNGTARADKDYTTVNQQITIPVGKLSASVQIPILNDLLVEPTEKFYVKLSNPMNASIGTAQATVNIWDEDYPCCQ